MRRRSLAALFGAAIVAGGITIPAANGRSAPSPSDVVSLVSVETPTRALRQRVVGLGLETADHADPSHVDVLLGGAADAAVLRSAGFRWTVVVSDMAARERERGQLDAAYAATADTRAMPSGRKAYRSLADYELDMRTLATRNPELVKLLTLPHRSVEGRLVHGLEITDNVTARDGKPVFALLGLHHAREWPSGEHTIELAFDLVKAWRAGDARAHDLLARARVIVVPVVNPDGYNVSFESAKVLDGNQVQGVESARGEGSLLYAGVQGAAFPAYKRKNCRMVDGAASPAGSCTAPGARHLGVDPNRNYAGLWGGAGASAFAGDDIYRGPAPFSEPETQNIRELVSHRQVTVLVSQHTFAGLVLRPPGIEDHGVTVDEPIMKELGAQMAAANGSFSEAGHELYDTSGTTEDWSYGATGGFGFTFELPVREFHPPFSETVASYFGARELAGRGNREALFAALAAAADPALHSVITADAPVGAVLRLQKSFDTRTSPVRAAESQADSDPTTPGAVVSVRDTLDTTMVSAGHVTWHVNPSTRPAVTERRVYGIDPTPVRSIRTARPTPPPKGHVDVPFTLTVDDRAAALRVALDWSTPDDLDLKVYRRVGPNLTLVASSGNPATFKERVEVDRAVVGDYVLRVTNFASVSSTFTVTAGAFRAGVTNVHPALVPFETWTLTCSTPAGEVLQTAKVQVNRGGRLAVDLSECRRRWPH